ncbi:MAG: hypothetical protein KatS3mg084_0319 [Candidatus Dojkabacteria bacterium]|nr:MAG: hypothetical protein KatS3mg084_0319 [Candidatus Dojkabacteria bacterium]
MSILDLLHTHICTAFDKQVALSEFLGQNYLWEIDLNKCVIKFSETAYKKRVSPSIQVLGTESKIDNSWLWAWANPELQNLPKLIEKSHQLNTVGIENSIPLLTNSIIALDKFPYIGHLVSLIAVSYFNMSGYFRAEIKDGFAYVLLENLPLELKITPQKIINNFNKLTKIFDFDHKLALRVYLPHHGYIIEEETNQQ